MSCVVGLCVRCTGTCHAFIGMFAKLLKAVICFSLSVCPSAHPYKTAQLPPVGFSFKFVFAYILTICQENSGLIKI